MNARHAGPDVRITAASRTRSGAFAPLVGSLLGLIVAALPAFAGEPPEKQSAPPSPPSERIAPTEISALPHARLVALPADGGEHEEFDRLARERGKSSENDEIVERAGRYWYHLTYPTGTLPYMPWERARDHVNDHVPDAAPWALVGAPLRFGEDRSAPGIGLETGAAVVAPQANTWVPIGPKPLDSTGTSSGFRYGIVSGRANVVYSDPTGALAGDRAWIGFTAGGLWRVDGVRGVTCPGGVCDVSGITATSMWDDEILTTQAVSAIEQDLWSDPSGDTIYVGTGDFMASDQFGVGIMKTTDGGDTWTQLGADVFTPFSRVIPQSQANGGCVGCTGSRWANQNIGWIKVDPNDPDTVLVGTRFDLYISHDAGSSWEVCDFGANRTNPEATSGATLTGINRISGMYLDARTSTTRAYVAVGYPFNTNNQNNGLYAFDVPAVGCPVWPGAFTNHFDGLPAGTGTATSITGRMALTGVVAADNRLTLYAQVSHADTGVLTAQGTYVLRPDDPAWPTAAGNPAIRDWRLLSNSGAANWVDCGGSVTAGTDQDWYDLFIAVNPTNDKQLYVGHVDLFKTSVNGTYTTLTIASGAPSAGGSNLSTVYSNGGGVPASPNCTETYGKVHPDQHAFDFVEGTGGVSFLAANDGGVYLNTNAGSASNWARLAQAGINTTQFYAGQVGMDFGDLDSNGTLGNPSDGRQWLLGGMQDNGCASWDSSTASLQWSARGRGGDGMWTAFDSLGGTSATGSWMTTSQGGNLACSTAGATGAYSPTCRPSEQGGESYDWAAPVVMDQFNCTNLNCSNVLFGGDYVRASTSVPLSWTIVSPLMPATAAGGSIVSLSTARSNPTAASTGTDDGRWWWSQTVFSGANCTAAAANTASFACTANAGATWLNIAAVANQTAGSDLFPNRIVAGVAFHPTDHKIVFAAIQGFGENTPTATGHIYQATFDTGTSKFLIRNKTGNLPDVPFETVAANPNRPNQVFAGGHFGFYFTDDITVASPLWQRYMEGPLPNTIIKHFSLDRGPTTSPKTSTTLTAFTFGRGVWAIKLPGASETFCQTKPAAPTGVGASSPVAGTVQVTWNDSTTATVSSYRVYRSTSATGPWTLAGTVNDGSPGVGGSGTYSFDDTGRPAGVQLYYMVRAAQVDGCASLDSTVVGTIVSGTCVQPPTFGGAVSVTELPGSTCGLQVSWNAAAASCAGETVTYSVYRSSSSSGPWTQLDSCLTGTSYTDTAATADVSVWYRVEAEDSTVNGAGSCNSGNLDANAVALSGRIFKTAGTATLFSGTFEATGSTDSWVARTFVSGSPSSWQGRQNCSGNINRFGGTTCAATYTDDNFIGYEPPTIEVPAGATATTLSFKHRFQFELGSGNKAYDGGFLALSLDATNFTQVPETALTGTVYGDNIENGAQSCAPGIAGGVRVWAGTSTNYATNVMQTSGSNLDTTCNTITTGSTGCAGQSLSVSFVGVTDCGTGAEGWFLDDVTVTANLPGSNCSVATQTLTVSRTGAGTGTVTSAPAGINCGGTCSFGFANGASVTLTAVAAGGSSFAGWSGEGCSGTGTCVVAMNGARAVTATFDPSATVPNTTLTGTEPDPTNDPTGDFTFTSNDPAATFECSVDGGAFAVCTTPHSTAVLGNGPHTFAVRAVNAALQADPTPATHGWTIDTVPPTTTITSAEPNPTNDATADFTFTSDDGAATFECSLDGGAYGACPASWATGPLGDGGHTLDVRAKDAAGNVDLTPASHAWTLDTAAPDTSLTVTEPNPTNDTQGDFEFTSPDGTATFECSLDGGAYATCTSPHETAVLGDGAHTFAVRAKDAAGNVDLTPASYGWTIDTAVPDTSFTATEPNPTNDSTGDFTFTSGDVTATFECNLDAAGWVVCSSPHATATLLDGPHTLEVRARDAAGNVDASPASHTWTVDTLEPSTSFTATEPSPTTDPTGDFTFTSDDGAATFECNLDNLGWVACTSPHSTVALGDGPHTLEVRAQDAAGNVDTTPASHNWTVDATAPDTSFTATEPSPTNDPTGDFTFSADDPAANFECNLDNVGWVACSSPHTTATLGNGSHTLEVRATDALGNVETSPASHTWTVDTSAPDTSFTATEPSPTNDPTGDFAFTSDDLAATFECNLDNAGWVACSSPHVTATLGNGPHTLEVRAKDGADNTDASPASHTWTVDTTAPDTTFTGTEPSPTNDPTGDFTFTSDDPAATFECNLDNAGWVACSSPHATATLGNGPHTLEVRAKDGAGNTDASPASHTWTVDTAAPDTSFTATEPSPTNDPTGDFTFSADDPAATFECNLDNAGWVVCTSPHSTAALSSGSHTLEVRGTDALGNVETSPASHTWTVDVTAPNTSFIATEPSPTNDPTGDFTFSADDPAATFECNLDNAGWVGCSSPHSTAALGSGSHTLEVRGTDALGNVETSPASHTWTVDVTAPNTSFIATEPSPTNDPTGDFTFSADDPAATFECNLDNAGWVGCTSPHSTAALGSGSHTLEVRGTDALGNVETSPATHTWTVDVTAPNTSFTATEPSPTNDPTGDFAFTADDPAATFECNLDNAGWVGCTSPHTTATLGDGPHTLEVRGTDALGNVETSPATHTWTVDVTAPNTSFTATEPSPTNDPTGDFAFTADDPAATFECNLDNTGWVGCSSPHATATVGDGSHTLEVRGTDAVGNVETSPASHTWTVDATAPNTSFIATEPSPTVDPTGDFTFSADDPAATFECNLDNDGWVGCSSPHTTVTLGDGSHTLQVRGTDDLGNVETSPASHTWTVDTTPPDTSFTVTAPSLTNDPAAFFVFSADDPAATFECNFDDAGWVACASPLIPSSLGDGSHTLQVRGTDALGNVETSPASHTWTIDTTPPSISLTEVEPDPTNDPTGDFVFTSPESPNVALQCRVDNASFQPCPGTFSTDPLPDGNHLFRARAVDLAGNNGPEQNWSWLVDTMAPSTTIVAFEPNPTADQTGEFSFTVSGAESGSTVEVECNLDGVGWTLCDSPYVTTTLSDGSHTLEIRASDFAGNVDATPSSYTWTVDSTAPDTSFTATEPTPTNDTTGDFAFSSTDGTATFECSLDGGAFAACPATHSTSPLGEGPHTLAVRARDAVGNVDATPVSHNWTVDTTPPDASFTTTEPNPTNDTTGDFAFTSNEAPNVTFRCRIDGGPYAGCPATFSTGPLPDGAHTLDVYATDLTGNDGPVASYSWTVDTTGPDTTIDAPTPANPTNLTSATFTFSSEANATFECKLDTGAFASCTSTKSYSGLAEGSHTFQVRGIDTLGNIDASPASFTWTVDTTPPDTTIASAPPTVTGNAAGSFTFASPDGTSFECSLDGGAFVVCSTLHITDLLTEGEHTLAVRAKDAAGNVDPTPASHTWTIDTTAPDTTIGTEPAAVTNDTTGDFTFTSNDAAATFECNLDAAGWVGCSSPHATAVLAQGSHTLQIRAKDAAGNVDPTPASRTWTIDTTAPDTSFTTTEPNPTNDPAGDFVFASNEAPVTFECSIDLAAFAPCTATFSTEMLPDGSHTIKVRAIDLAGNVDPTEASYTWTVARDPLPSDGFESGNLNGWTSHTP